MANLEDLTTRCIRCGFCLEACPTFTTTASELESPRGRIYLVRSAEEGLLDWQDDVRPHLDRCLGCLACQTACPSGVQYGEILELARDKIERQKGDKPKSLLLKGLTHPTLLRAQLTASALLPGRRIPGFVSRALSGQPPEADKPVAQKPADLPPVHGLPVKGEVFLLEGCAMRVLFPRVHQATRRLLRRVGYVVREAKQGCCGALHAHSGHLKDAEEMSSELFRDLPGDLPVIVDSAGCGSHLKGPMGGADSRRIFDASEFLFQNGLTEILASSAGLNLRIAYHDACHLAHGQGIREEPRRLLAAIPGVELVPLPEADTCCGSAGTYNLTEPGLARKLLDRKWANIEATGAEVVALGNPGCHAWIAQASREHGRRVRVMHTMEVLEAAFVGADRFM
jgi:glycolate oxidase iron-sulfur subunit